MTYYFLIVVPRYSSTLYLFGFLATDLDLRVTDESYASVTHLCIDRPAPDDFQVIPVSYTHVIHTLQARCKTLHRSLKHF